MDIPSDLVVLNVTLCITLLVFHHAKQEQTDSLFLTSQLARKNHKSLPKLPYRQVYSQ